MNRKFSAFLKKALFLAGALTLGWAARAQSSDNNMKTDTTHQHMMHHRWGNRPGGPGHDSLAFRHHGEGRDGYAFHRPGQGRFRQHGHGHDFVHYTPEQRKQVMAINKDYRQKTADLFKQDNITLKQYKAGLIALQKEKKSKLQALLTPQQKEEIAARRNRMSENTQVMAAARLERLKLRLSLSDDQVAKIKAGQESLRSQFQAIHENDDLLPQQKRAQMKALMATRNDTFKSVLTPDQYTKFQQLSHHRPGGPWQGGYRQGGSGQGHGFGGPTI
jgi:Spy/CpxP family protein refolding chaperone